LKNKKQKRDEINERREGKSREIKTKQTCAQGG